MVLILGFIVKLPLWDAPRKAHEQFEDMLYWETPSHFREEEEYPAGSEKKEQLMKELEPMA